MKHVAFFDVDGTVIRGYTQKYLLEYMYERRVINFPFIAKSNFWFLLYKLRISRDVSGAMRLIYRHFTGWDSKSFHSFIECLFERYLKNQIYKDAVKCIESLSNKGFDIILISSSISPIVEKIQSYVGAHDLLCTNLEFENGKLTGDFLGPVNYADNRILLFNKLIDGYQSRFAKIRTFFFTDHYSDYQLLQSVDKPIVVNPDRLLRRIALARKWGITYFK